MTYSIIGRDPENQEIGAAVQSKLPGVGSIVLHGRAGVGCVTTQAFANPRHGEIGLNLLSTGAIARIALNDLLHDDPSRGRRQVAILGTAGEPATFSAGKAGPAQPPAGTALRSGTPWLEREL